jgi:hemoglobin
MYPKNLAELKCLAGTSALDPAVHRGLHITEEQRQRFIALFTAAFEEVGHGDDRELRDAVLSCIEFGTEVAKVNSNARSDAELHPQREMPKWHW